MALKQMIMSMKPLSASELEKVKASQAIQQAKRKEQEVKKTVGIDKIEREADKAVRASAIEASIIASASIPPSLLAKVSKGEKLTPTEQTQLASFMEALGYL